MLVPELKVILLLMVVVFLPFMVSVFVPEISSAITFCGAVKNSATAVRTMSSPLIPFSIVFLLFKWFSCVLSILCKPLCHPFSFPTEESTSLAMIR